MSSVVFLRAVNVGGANSCRPAQLARELEKFNIVNIGAVGTFVVRENVAESILRTAIARKLPFKCEIMIVAARSILHLAGSNPFARQPPGPDVTRFVTVLRRPAPKPVVAELLRISPFKPQTSKGWLLKIVSIDDRFVVGLYRRQMKAIGYLGKIEKILGVPATTRSWTTMEKIVKILKQDRLN